MIGNNMKSNIIPRDKLDSIEFKMLSPDTIKKMAVVKVVTPELYDADGYPIDNSLMDLKMGVIDPGLRCRTCGAKVRDCPGHFGYIDLARPIFHIRYMPLIYAFLKSTCDQCGRILLSDKDIEKWMEKLKEAQIKKGEIGRKSVIKALLNKTKVAKKCPHCGAKQEKIKLVKPSSFVENNKKINTHRCS